MEGPRGPVQSTAPFQGCAVSWGSAPARGAPGEEPGGQLRLQTPHTRSPPSRLAYPCSSPEPSHRPSLPAPALTPAQSSQGPGLGLSCLWTSSVQTCSPRQARSPQPLRGQPGNLPVSLEGGVAAPRAGGKGAPSLPGAVGQVPGPWEEAGAAPCCQAPAGDTSSASSLTPSQSGGEGCLIMVPPGPSTVSSLPSPSWVPQLCRRQPHPHGRSITQWLLPRRKEPPGPGWAQEGGQG